MSNKTAAILAIGDELLSGRTRDANIHHLAGWLTERGVDLKEARIVADDREAISSALTALRLGHDYVFTSGGIGPTHDDITYDAVAASFLCRVEENTAALNLIEAWYLSKGQEVTPARRRMALMPQGAELIMNPVSGAPGVRIGNVFVMAGVPSIFQGMLAAVDQVIARGAKIHAVAVTAIGLPESRIADRLREIQAESPGVSIGSYPIDGDEKGVTIIARSGLEERAAAAIAKVADAMQSLGFQPIKGEKPGRI